jgi:hypothetical protein
MARTIQASLVFLTCVVALGCSGDNEPATQAAPATGASGTMPGGTTATGATDTTATDTTATDTTTTDTTATDTTATDTTATDTTATDTAADNSSLGATLGDPPCDLTRTAAGEEIKKGTPCTDADPALCWRGCGPQSVGWKSETCSGGSYVEGDCQFPPEDDYSCFAIPETLHPDCPAETPQATMECNVLECNSCNVDNQYLTSSGEAKVGYCICQPPNSAGSRSWSCSSGTAWPCPLGQGC